VNLALGKHSNSSSVGWHGEAQKAVDGATNNGVYENSVKGTCAHTSSDTANNANWISVDLGESVQIGAIVLVGRGDCCNYQSSGWTIRVGDSGTADDPYCAQNVDAAGGGNVTITCSVASEGRFVSVWSSRWIALCEIEVYRAIYPPSNSGSVLELTGDSPKLAVGDPHAPVCEISLDSINKRLVSTCPLQAMDGRRLEGEMDTQGVRNVEVEDLEELKRELAELRGNIETLIAKRLPYMLTDEA